eukprot:TRINITY_DN931_c2_g1_i1.p1 TRINITY_DN931_c2_g1~~TRINITY_DN931_c2_g1_i1.p1  ORF type:complete len:446 (+),score=88.10 TRINITY_DN931_c2_g1_i1:51-1340(+)
MPSPDEILEEVVAEGSVPGIYMKAVKDGKVCYEKGVGWADEEKNLKMGSKVIGRFYSMTKPVVSTAAMMLWEEGKLDLNENVSAYIPEWEDDKKVMNHDGTTVPATRPITIIDLMTHTSGLDYGFWPDTVSKTSTFYRRLGLELPTPILHDADSHLPAPSRPKTLKEFCSTLNKVPLSFQPGERFQYSCSTDVLGRVIESITGETLPQFLNRKLFTPLEMSDTSFTITKDKLPRMAKCYYGISKGQYKFAADNFIGNTDDLNPWMAGRGVEDCPSGGGGLLSTVDDFLIFGGMMLTGSWNGQTYLKESTVEMMREDQLAPRNAKKSSIAQVFDGFGLGLGLALSPGTPASYPGAGLAGHGTAGWGGAANTVYFSDPVHNVTFVIFSQLLNYHVSVPMLRFNAIKALYEAMLGREAAVNDGESASGGFTG